MFRYYLISLSLLLLVNILNKLLFLVAHFSNFSNLTLKQVSQALSYGLRFDLSVVGLLSLIPLMVALLCFTSKREKKLRFNIYYLLIPILTLTQFSDTVYFSYTGKHVSYEVNNIFTDSGSLIDTAFSHPLLLIFSIAIISLSFLLISRLKPITITSNCYFRNIFAFCVLFINIILIRGGVQATPMSPIFAYNLGQAQLANIAINGFYNSVYWLVQDERVVQIPLPAIKAQELQKSLAYIKANHRSNPKPKQSANIVFLFLEGWASNNIKSYGYARDTAPFFDSIRAKSITTDLMFAGGLRTTEGMFASLCSMQNPLGQTIANSSLQDNNYLCLPEILSKKAYDSAFFQGTFENTSYTGSFAKKLGFKQSYGKVDIDKFIYPKNTWGAHDLDIYNFALKKIAQFKQPFLVGINTNSTHDSQLPPGVKAKYGMDNKTNINDSLLSFADDALKSFFDNYQKLNLSKPTIFVLVGDHTAGTYALNIDSASVAFAIFAPNIGTIHRPIIASQRDIAPTVFDMLGIKIPRHFSGQSLLANHNPSFADFYLNGILSWAENNTVVEIPINSSKPNCYQYLKYQSISVSCDLLNTNINRALSFTKTSQDLLFSGKSLEYNWQNNK